MCQIVTGSQSKSLANIRQFIDEPSSIQLTNAWRMTFRGRLSLECKLKTAPSSAVGAPTSSRTWRLGGEQFEVTSASCCRPSGRRFLSSKQGADNEKSTVGISLYTRGNARIDKEREQAGHN
ncbi:hypothetical protein KIN20_002745 [Parelaphostrongylus tenuis]|uniref:Uncharacterized protein n=1 Tax=Parelaphostrongylus tenuis TaxID=148309 RepID=A0AAD5QDQ7_PARTN|nr:hypothetical protein KIN20_002745 [Parelaphostrongylus tenuis]